MYSKRNLFVLFSVLIVSQIAVITPAKSQEERPSVFRELHFGDSKRDARITVLEDNFFNVPLRSLGKEALSPEGNIDLKLESVGLDLVFFFNQKGLYRMDATGRAFSVDQFDTKLKNQLETIRSTISNRYNEPSMTKRQEPEDIENGDFKMVAYWSASDLDDKRNIWVGISRSNQVYKPSLIIQDPSRADAPGIQEKSEDSTEPRISAKNAKEHF